mgnify:CR=1 FL=1
MWVFAKSIETRKGNFAVGQALPPEWDTRETRNQLVEKFGEGVIVQAQAFSMESIAMSLSAIQKSLDEIKSELGIKSQAAKKLTGKAKGSA